MFLQEPWKTERHFLTSIIMIIISVSENCKYASWCMTLVYIYTSDLSDIAIPGVDFDFMNMTNETRYFNFTISSGSTRSFPLTIIDDSVAENEYERIYYRIGVYDSGQLFNCDYGYIDIEDNDGRCNLNTCMQKVCFST